MRLLGNGCDTDAWPCITYINPPACRVLFELPLVAILLTMAVHRWRVDGRSHVFLSAYHKAGHSWAVHEDI